MTPKRPPAPRRATTDARVSRDGQSYAVHGVRLRVCSDHPGTAAALHRRLRRFVTSAAATPPDIAVAIHCVAAGREHPCDRPAAPTRPVYDAPAGEVLYAPAEDRMYIDYLGRVRVCCDAGAGRIQMSIRASDPDAWWLAAHPLFTLPFVETMKRHGRYMMHAAGLSRDGRALLLPGASGVGKSTLTLALLRAGFDLLGDDTCFLATTLDGLRVLPFPDAMNVTDDTVRRFPELERALDPSAEGPRPHGPPKRSVLPEDVYAVAFAEACAPAVVVFPTIGTATRSVLRPLDPAAALLELTPNVLLTERQRSQAHLDALAALVRASRCYRLETGRDFDALPTLLGSLLA